MNDITKTVADFKVPQRVFVQRPDQPLQRGTLVKIEREHPFPLVVKLDSGDVAHTLPREADSIPRSQRYEDVEAWLAE